MLEQIFPGLSNPNQTPQVGPATENRDGAKKRLLLRSLDTLTDREVDFYLKDLGLYTGGSLYAKRERIREALASEDDPLKKPGLPEQKKKGPAIQVQSASEGEVLKIDETKGGVLVLRGRVQIKINNGILKADTVSIDSKRQELYAEGGVTYEDGIAKVKGDKFLFDSSSGKGVIYDVKATLYPAFFIGKRLKKLDEERFLLEMGHFTACNAEIPHYSFEAKRIIIYQDQTLIAFNLNYKVGGTSVFWFPMIYNSQNGNGWTVQAGKNISQGFFLQNSYQWSDPISDRAILPQGYKVRADFYEKTGQAAQLEMWKLSPWLNYDIKMGYANHKQNVILPAIEDRNLNGGVGNVVVSNQVDRGAVFREDPSSGFRDIGVKYDAWQKYNVNINAKSFDTAKDANRNFQVRFDDYTNRFFDYEYGNRYEPVNTLQSIYTRRDQRFGLIPNTLNWRMNYTENRGDLSVAIGMERNQFFYILPNNRSDFFPIRDTIPRVSIRNSTQIGNLPYYGSPIYWDFQFTTSTDRFFGFPTQRPFPYATPFTNNSTVNPLGEYRDNPQRTQTFLQGETGFRSTIPLGTYVTITPGFYVGAQKNTAQFQQGLESLPANQTLLQFLRQESYQYVRQQHQARIGIPLLFLTTIYRRTEAEKPEVVDPILGRVRRHELEVALESYASDRFEVSLRTIRDLRQFSSSYQPEVNNSFQNPLRWYFTVFRLGTFFDFVDGFRPKRTSLLERQRAFYSGIYVNNDYVHHTALARPLSNNVTISYKMGGFSLPFIRNFRTFELGATWYHVFRDPRLPAASSAALDSYRFYFQTDAKITRSLGMEMTLDSRVTEPWRLTNQNANSPLGVTYGNSNIPISSSPGFYADNYTAVTGNATDYSRTNIFQDIAYGLNPNDTGQRRRTVFNINKFMTTAKLNLHNWEYRLTYSMDLRTFPSGGFGETALTFYDQSVFFSVNLLNFSLGEADSSEVTRARLFRFRKRPLDAVRVLPGQDGF